MKSNLEKRIQRRVILIYVARTLFQPPLVKLYIVAALIFQATGSVSFTNVFTNASSALNISKMYRFYMSAFVNTELAVQVAIIGTALLGVWILKDLGRVSLSTHRSAEV